MLMPRLFATCLPTYSDLMSQFSGKSESSFICEVILSLGLSINGGLACRVDSKGENIMEHSGTLIIQSKALSFLE